MNQDDTSTLDAGNAATANPWQTPDSGAAAPAPMDVPGGADAAAGSTAPAPTDAWSNATDTGTNTDWLGAAPTPDAGGIGAGHFHLSQLWDGSLPIEQWINDGLNWVVAHGRPFFQAVRPPVDALLGSVESLLQGVPPVVMVGLLGLLAWQFAGRAIAVGAVLSLAVIGVLGIWSEAMTTLSLVLTALFFCLAIGLPLGVLLAASDRAQRIARPVLDAMQTTPAFVYLVPVVMLFGIGNVPGVVVTIVFALPPLVRLTNLGIRQVRPDLIEASRAYGASPWQLLTKVQLPLAMPSIMAGINQALMLSLSMVVIASMIAVGGLGQMVLRGIGRLDMGLATIGGLGIVMLAITLDRFTQALGTARRGSRHWWERGPAGLLRALLLRAFSGARRAGAAQGEAASRTPTPVVQNA